MDIFCVDWIVNRVGVVINFGALRMGLFWGICSGVKGERNYYKSLPA